MQKSAVAPIITVLILVAQNIFGVQLPDGIDKTITEIIMNALAVYVVIAHGINKNHQKQAVDVKQVQAAQEVAAPVDSTK